MAQKETEMEDARAKAATEVDTNILSLREGVASYLHDADPEETQEWMDSLDGLLEDSDPERARYLMLRLIERANAKRVPLRMHLKARVAIDDDGQALHPRGRARAGQCIDLTTSSVIFLASPNSIEVWSAKNSGFSIPAYPDDIERLSTMTDCDSSTFRIGIP